MSEIRAEHGEVVWRMAPHLARDLAEVIRETNTASDSAQMDAMALEDAANVADPPAAPPEPFDPPAGIPEF